MCPLPTQYTPVTRPLRIVGQSSCPADTRRKNYNALDESTSTRRHARACGAGAAARALRG
ncbi:hypothetical protein C5615_18515 [Burkholderia cepacia]|uniref:Uncharacterized protein n=1 Tax=Burkholderia cepacia TaxID=292 RepID=A0A2S8IQ28_BURCE|nr:hypothetical protein C5615_18515 [Burkholderia cepacia]